MLLRSADEFYTCRSPGLYGFAAKWEQKYKHAILSWKTNWDNLTSYFDFPMEIRKIIYTTNTIENVNRASGST
ncbi:transposase [Niastella sp. OAS944]|uniref:transposase n=1 Tax=Niastella sp. OAS944 TaxID=2664089 RepID=UPI0035C7F74C